MSVEAKQIYTRLPDEDGGYMKFPACLVGEGIALAIYDDQLEVHLVKETDDPNEYDLVQQSNPMFYVGDDTATVISDIDKLTMMEFARKYKHSDFEE